MLYLRFDRFQLKIVRKCCYVIIVQVHYQSIHSLAKRGLYIRIEQFQIKVKTSFYYKNGFLNYTFAFKHMNCRKKHNT